MGKKNLRRKQRVNKVNFQDQVGRFMDLIHNELACSFNCSMNEGPGKTMMRLSHFWACGPRTPRFIDVVMWWNMFRSYPDKMCGEYFVFHKWQRLMKYVKRGEFEIAKAWFLTIQIITIMGRDQGKEMDCLRRLNDFIARHDECLHETHPCCFAHHPYLLTAYQVTKSKVNMTAWIYDLQRSTLYRDLDMKPFPKSDPKLNILSRDKYHFILNGPRIIIGIVNKFEESGRKLEMSINLTIQLKTLMRIVTGNLKSHPSLKRYKLVHLSASGCTKGTLLVKDSGHKTLEEAGLVNSDILHIYYDDKKKQISRTKNVEYSTNDDKDRIDHSKLLSRIFEEASELFQKRRQQLNDLATKKCVSKQKPIKSKSKSIVPEPVKVDHCCSLDVHGKAGKACFPVLVGHKEFLYRSSKSQSGYHKSPLSIDLHGCTKAEAIQKLNSSLPTWVNVAMNEFPWTIPVNVITGGGCQILAEAVKCWIRDSKNVANRF